MSKVTIAGDANGTGVFTLAAPNGNTNRTLVLPDEAGTVLTSVSNLAGLTGVPASGAALFSAKFVSSLWAQATNQIIPFNAINFDDDGVFSTATSAFTAPANGVYLFWYSVYTANSNADNKFGLFKNNAVLNFQQGSTGQLSHVSGTISDHVQSASAVVRLSASDTIAVAALSLSDYYTGHSQWGGVRLS